MKLTRHIEFHWWPQIHQGIFSEAIYIYWLGWAWRSADKWERNRKNKR